LRLAVLAATGIAFGAQAQSWPSKPIRWVVPFPPGGSNDISSRLIAERLSQVFAQPVVVENRAGAGGIVGAEIVAKSRNDGYTVLSISDSLASQPHLHKALTFDPLKDFAPVVQMSRQAVVLAVHPSLGVSSAAELIDLARRKPGIAYATSGAGTQQHIAAEWFASAAGIKLTHVPYKGGGQAITDLVGGQVTLASLGSSPLIPYHRSGKLRIIAQSTHSRTAALPDIPTFEELGFKGVVIEQWQGLFVPAGTPRAVVERLNAEVLKALGDGKIRERFAQAGLEPVGNSPEQFAKAFRADYASYGRLVKELKISIE
jgi:tripartite-type tricarboxylate transporter receptor subunit TctC